MKLHEIIKNFEDNKELSYSVISPYKKQLHTYFKEYYGGTPVLLLTTVTNAYQSGIIVADHMLYDSVYDYLDVDYIEEDENSPDFDFDLFCEYETILANSQYLENIL